MGKQVAARLKQKNHRISGVDINKRLNSDEIAGIKFLLPDDCSNSQKFCERFTMSLNRHCSLKTAY